MSDNKRSLKSYLKGFEESQEKKTTKSSRHPIDKGEHQAAPTAHAARKKPTKRKRAASSDSSGQRPEVLPPPELGDNLNA